MTKKTPDKLKRKKAKTSVRQRTGQQYTLSLRPHNMTCTTNSISNILLNYIRTKPKFRLAEIFAKHELLKDSPLFRAIWFDKHQNRYEGFIATPSSLGRSLTNQQRMTMKPAIDLLLESGMKKDANDSKKVDKLTFTDCLKFYARITHHTEKAIRLWYTEHDQMVSHPKDHHIAEENNINLRGKPKILIKTEAALIPLVRSL